MFVYLSNVPSILHRNCINVYSFATKGRKLTDAQRDALQLRFAASFRTRPVSVFSTNVSGQKLRVGTW